MKMKLIAALVYLFAFIPLTAQTEIILKVDETFSNVDPELSYYLSEEGLDELLEGFSVKDILETK